jgi:hypothetical protein
LGLLTSKKQKKNLMLLPPLQRFLISGSRKQETGDFPAEEI